MSDWNVVAIRSLFPGLEREVCGRQAAFFDGPAGSQVPESVANAVQRYLLDTNSNCGAVHETSVESDRLLKNAHHVVADFLGATVPESVCFGANMTTITLSVSRALARHWKAGDEIIVSSLDHDANVTPWVLAAQDAGVIVHHIPIRRPDWTLDLDAYESLLSPRTKLVAVGYASNATGTINPVEEIVERAKDAGALTYIDAVHFAPHGRINVSAIGCDFLVCSAYKFFGPHVGILYGQPELLQNVRPYKLRPSPETLPGRWMMGTQNHEGIAGTAAAVEYLAELDTVAIQESGCNENTGSTRSAKLDRVFSRIRTYEQSLSRRFLDGISTIRGVELHGISDLDRLEQRVPTFSMSFENMSPAVAAERLAKQGVFAWGGNHYALPFTAAAGLEPEGTLPIGALHYNTLEEVDRAVECLKTIVDL